MANDYYYLVAGLPDISLSEGKNCPAYNDFTDTLLAQLEPKDAELVRLIRFEKDNENLIRLIENRTTPFNPNGNFSRAWLEEAVKTREGLPEYMIVFLEAFDTRKAGVSGRLWEDELAERYFDFLQSNHNPFIREWAIFEMELRNALVAETCKSTGLDPSRFRVEGQTRKIESRFEELPALSDLNPVEQALRLDALRWAMLDQMTSFTYFSIENILCFVLKLGLADRWKRLLPDDGRVRLEEFQNRVREQYKDLLPV